MGYSRAGLAAAIDQFMSGEKPKAKGRRRARRSGGTAALENAPQLGQDQAIVASKGTPFPVYYPTKIAPGGQYQGPGRPYRLRDLKGTKRRAYRMVVELPESGQYYGIQGMNWLNPPILQKPDQKKTIRGRTYAEFFDGSHLRLVAFRVGGTVYWVSNTLTRDLTNKQMLGIAESLRPLGR